MMQYSVTVCAYGEVIVNADSIDEAERMAIASPPNQVRWFDERDNVLFPLCPMNTTPVETINNQQ